MLLLVELLLLLLVLVELLHALLCEAGLHCGKLPVQFRVVGPCRRLGVGWELDLGAVLLPRPATE